MHFVVMSNRVKNSGGCAIIFKIIGMGIGDCAKMVSPILWF